MQHILKSIQNWVLYDFLDLETQDEREHPEKYMTQKELEQTRVAIKWMKANKNPRAIEHTEAN